MKKTFDLNYYLEHPETKVVTRGGTSGHAKNARIISTDTKSINGYIITALIPTGPQGSENAYSFDINGRYMGGTTKSELDLFFDLPDPIKTRVPLTYEDLLERVKAGKTLFVDYTTEDMAAQIVTFSANKVAVAIRGKIYELSYRWMLTYYFVDGDKCWKEVDSCDTCTNDKGCVTCNDGDQWEGGEK